MTRWLIDTASHTFYALILLLALIAAMMASATPASAQGQPPAPFVPTNPYWSVPEFVDYFCGGIEEFLVVNKELGRIVPVTDPDMQAWFREEFDMFVLAAEVQVVGTPPKNVDCEVFHP